MAKAKKRTAIKTQALGSLMGQNLTCTDYSGVKHQLTEGKQNFLTNGSILFSDGANISEDNNNLFWDDINNRLGIGTASPTEKITLDLGTTQYSTPINICSLKGIGEDNGGEAVSLQAYIGFGAGELEGEILPVAGIQFDMQGLNFEETEVDRIFIFKGNGSDFKIQNGNIFAPNATISNNLNVSGNSTVNGVRNQKYYHESYQSSSSTLNITATNTWYGYAGATEGLNQGFTWHPGESGTITAIADAGGGQIQITANNTLVIGDPVTLVGGTGYDGVYLVTGATSTTFNVTATYTATGTGTYIQPDNWEATVAGVYDTSGNTSVASSIAGSEIEVDIFKNTTRANKGSPQRKFSTANDIRNLFGQALLNLSAGDRVFTAIRSLSGTPTLTLKSLNVKTIRF